MKALCFLIGLVSAMLPAVASAATVTIVCGPGLGAGEGAECPRHTIDWE